jgi:chromosome segregation ATPase
MVQDRLHRIKQEAASITKSCDTLDKHNWKELQQYDEQIAALKNDVKNENSQITQLTKQHQELQNKFKSLQSYFK